MKKVPVILLSLFFLFNSIGFMMMYQYLLCGIRVEMMKMAHSDLPGRFQQKITLDKADMNAAHGFAWTDDNDEFCLKGNMYDVTKMETNGNTVTIFCLNDTDEENLTAWLFHQLQDSSGGNHQQKTLASFSVSDFLTTPYFSLSPVLSGQSIHIMRESSFPASFDSYLKVSPPPRFV